MMMRQQFPATAAKPPFLHCLMAIGLLAMSTPAQAQQHPDVIRGHVTTDSGTTIAGANIVVTRAPDRATFAATTGADGRYEAVIPNGTGDYLVHVSALGRQTFRKRVTRVGSDTAFVVDARLASSTQQLGPVVVQGTTPKPVRGSGRGFASEPGAAETLVGGVGSVVPPDQAGDLNSVVATVPGIVATGTGVSAFGLGPAQNSTTLNGLAFGGSDVPREVLTRTRVTTSTYDPSRGWFSGANVNVDVAGGNLLAARRGSVTVDAPAAQYTDAISARLGQRYTNLRLNVGGDGPLTFDDRNFYSYGAQYARRVAGIATINDATTELLTHSGVSHDSVVRLLQIASAANIPIGSAPASQATDDASFIVRFDHAPFDWSTSPPTASPRTIALTGYGKWSRATSLALGPTAGTDHGAESWRGLGMVQGNVSQYWGKDFLTDVRSGVTYNRSSFQPTLQVPDGRVLVGSDFPDATSGFTNLSVGGNATVGADSRQTTWETTAETQFYARQRPAHRIKISADARLDDYALDFDANRLGTFSYASLADFAANQPVSFSRALNAPVRSGGAWNGFLAGGDDWQVTRAFRLLYGARLEGSAFTAAPAYNPLVDQEFGARTDGSPRSIHISPRLGFSWLRNPAGYGNGAASPLGSFGFQPASALRGGIGEFRSMQSPLLLNNAIVSTGLPGGLTRLSCFGAAVPTPDWAAYAANAGAIPTQCAGGANAAFSDGAPSVQLFDRSFQPPRSWRGNLAYTSRARFVAYTIDGVYSYGLNQPSTVDLNLRGVPSFVTSDEGRPVLVPASAILPNSGALSPVPGRIDGAFARVMSSRSDLRSIARQATLTLAPNLSAAVVSRWVTSLSYTLSSVRTEQRGFDGSTFAGPAARDWGRGDLDARHQFVLQAGYRKNGFNFTAFGRAISGLPFTPIVGADINGDGLANDRAFIFDPARVADAVFAKSLDAMRAVVSPSVRSCLNAQINQAARRNSCEGPWTTALNMQVSASGARLKLASRISSVTLNLANPLGGLDQLLHGEGNLRGWGTPAAIDPVLYQVRGFDASSSRFIYSVNPRFGAPSAAVNTSRAPFRLTLDVSMNLGRPAAIQQIDRWVSPGRNRPGTKLGVADLKKRYQTSVPNPYPGVLQLTDSLLLSRDQLDAVQHAGADYARTIDSAWTDLATYLANLPGSYDLDEAVKHQEATIGDVWELTRLHVQENLRRVLTPVQQTMLGGWAAVFNSATTSMKAVRIVSGIRPS